jgi:FtsP/CotA-like multicopper oxidase with cupredoxin domain
MLGSIEDWFIINTMNFGHPIHIHLINYQVLNSYSVRYLSIPIDPNTTKNCSLYNLDFLITAIKISNNSEI